MAATCTGTASHDVTYTTDTTVEWEPQCFVVRRHWWSRRKTVGKYFATQANQPGMWGLGDTPDDALDDLVECIRDSALVPTPEPGQ